MTLTLPRAIRKHPVTVVATTVPDVYRSARLLGDSSSAGVGARLGPIESFPGGEAFRVERRDRSAPRP